MIQLTTAFRGMTLVGSAVLAEAGAGAGTGMEAEDIVLRQSSERCNRTMRVCGPGNNTQDDVGTDRLGTEPMPLRATIRRVRGLAPRGNPPMSDLLDLRRRAPRGLARYLREMAIDQPLWHCKKCGREFANRNQSHACGTHDLEHHFRGKPAAIRALYDRVVKVVNSIGPARVLPEKTRIAFQVRMSFAQITPRQRWLDGHVVLARRLESPRFRRIDTIS